jgi:predicted RNase H-like nuclease
MDDAIASMTPEQATARLAEMGAASNPAPGLVAMDSQDARAQLNLLSSDSSWATALMSGNAAVRDQFDRLVAIVDAGDVVADTLANIQEEPPLIETTTGGQLPSRVVREVIAGMRDAGVSDGAIAQAMRGDPVTAAEFAAAKAFQAMRHSDPEWVSSLLRGDWSSNREHQLMSIILSSDIAEPK